MTKLGSLFFDEKSELDKKPVIIKAMRFAYNFSVGSSDSLEFHSTLGLCPQDSIFKTEAI